MAFLDETGLAHFWNHILARLNNFVPAEAGKGLSTNDYTTAEKTKLSGIASGAEVNVQSDWNETNTTSDAYILNKPIAQNVTLLTVSEYTADEIQALWDSIFV